MSKEITLYCLPFAGGHAHSYRDFQANVTYTIKIKSLELPGHGRRIREPLLTNLEAMVDDIFHQFKNDMNGQAYGIYGHSMGTLLGYLLTQRILKAGLPAPLHLFFSGRKAPSLPTDTPYKYLLSKEDFLNHLTELGGMSEILAVSALIDLMEPILRADFQAIETYVYQPSPKFDIPITILQGLTDQKTSTENLLPWQQETSQPIEIKSFQGGHFFIFEQIRQLGQLFSRVLITNANRTITFT